MVPYMGKCFNNANGTRLAWISMMTKLISCKHLTVLKKYEN